MPIDSFPRRILTAIRKERLLSQGNRVVVAVSGGPDSVALLRVLLDLQPALSLQIEAAHFNHCLRGAESEEDEQFVCALCAGLGITLHRRRAETKQAATLSRRNLEDYARHIRYQFLYEIAIGREAVITTGHNMNDQAETFLLKLFRGAGISGLAGIHVRRRNVLTSGNVCDVVRPLLGVTRREIVDYLATRDQPYRSDSSNRDVTFDRNWLRNELIPMLAEKFNPAIVRILATTADSLGETNQLVETLAERVFRRCRRAGRDAVVFDIDCLLENHPALVKETIRFGIREIKGDLRDIHRKHIDGIARLARAQSGGQLHLPGDLRIRREFDNLVIGRPTEIPRFSHPIEVPGAIRVPELGKALIVRRSEDTQLRPGRDLVQIPSGEVRVRNRLPGDRFQSKAGSPERKLKEILIERKVPRSARDRLLILAQGPKLLWVESLGANAGQSSPSPGQASPNQESFEISVEAETFSE